MSPVPYVSLIGGYQSASIILTDGEVGVIPYGNSDTLINPDTDYEFTVHLSQSDLFTVSAMPATLTVKFWAFEGGPGTAGELLDEQQVSIAPIADNQLISVTSRVPFHSAALGMHHSAVVSISNLLSGSGYPADLFNSLCSDAADPSEVLPPVEQDHLTPCSAWRTTISMAPTFTLADQLWVRTWLRGSNPPQSMLLPGPVPAILPENGMDIWFTAVYENARPVNFEWVLYDFQTRTYNKVGANSVQWNGLVKMGDKVKCTMKAKNLYGGSHVYTIDREIDFIAWHL